VSAAASNIVVKHERERPRSRDRIACVSEEEFLATRLRGKKRLVERSNVPDKETVLRTINWERELLNTRLSIKQHILERGGKRERREVSKGDRHLRSVVVAAVAIAFP
jgi:hypothetical protein